MTECKCGLRAECDCEAFGDNLEAVRADNVARCIEQINKGHPDASLRIMGFADGCIREARQRDPENLDPYGPQNHPLKP